ncbi:MAG: Glucose-1-phosphate cytidylyltransferase [uncultured Acidimicrobiales bacterium]|uniref:Glucose-1-phosphate cytidylyltransferase n=1 Tax=uncultured Acidimicrobiales bacterium TaxID=310071 RepID=A0A6J4H3C2_9ACTN|nr:MAG: Glucose-1-phosphate cytidylyltransferase [uncultured Acidimicrobiales bacterium]
MTTPVAEIPVVILCGGLGTRLREATETVPKPLVDVGGKPILWHIMKTYSHFGFRRFVLALGYRSFDIKEYFLRYREHLSDFTLCLSDDHEPIFHDKNGDEDWEISCIETGLLTGTGGRISRVRQHLDKDIFMMTYGDGIGNVDLDALLERHYAEGRIGTVTAVHPTSRYGEMRVEGAQIVEFNEKPQMVQGLVSGGFFAFQREMLNYLSDDEGLFLEQGPLGKLAADGQLSVFPHEGFWMGMDTFRDYTELNSLWSAGNPPWKVWA